MAESAVLGFCGRCGAPFTTASGGFCGRCGNAIVAAPPVARGYSYPVAPPGSVPAMLRKLPPARLWMVVGGVIGVIVVIITIVAVAARPLTTPCHFSCGSHTGPPLIGNTLYTNAKFGYSVEYLGSLSKVDSTTADGVVLTVSQSQISFVGSSGTDLDAAMQTAFNAINTNLFQDLQPVGAVRGAEIGLVPAKGTAYKGTFVPANGGNSIPVAAIVMAATSNNITITAVMFSPYTTDVQAAPYGLSEGTNLDYPITLTHFPGS